LRKLGRKYIHQVLSQQVDNELKNMGITGYSIENVTQTVTKEGTPVPIDSDQDPTVILVHYESIIPRQINYVSPSVKNRNQLPIDGRARGGPRNHLIDSR